MEEDIKENFNRIQIITNNEVCEFNKTIIEGNLNQIKRCVENLIARNKELEENYKRLQNTEAVKEYYLPKKKIKEILKQRLKKYQEDDDGEYKQEYLTRGELELVDRYKECSELLKILCEEDIYKIELDYISKSKIKEKIEEINKEMLNEKKRV